MSGYTTEEMYDENPTVTAAEASRELRKHGATLEAFQAEVGIQESYKGLDVLRWLGY